MNRRTWLFLWLGWPLIVVPAAVWEFRYWSGESSEPLALHLKDWDGHERSLEDFRGKVVMVYFGYTRCPEACPLEFFRLSRVMKQLGAARARVQVLFITLDPDRDTPQLLKAYLNVFDSGFLALSGSTTDIASAARTFHVIYVRTPAGNDYFIDHTSVTYLIDKQGYLRFREPPSADTEDYIRHLNQLL